MDRTKRLKGSKFQEIGGRMGKRDHQRAIIGRLYAYFGKIRELAGIIVLAVENIIELIRIFRGCHGAEGALPRIDKIGRRDRVAVAPFDAGSKMESVSETVGRDGPCLRLARNNITPGVAGGEA